MDGIDVEDSMEGSWFYSLDVIEAHEVDPLMSHGEEVDSSLKAREEHSNAIQIDSKESSNSLVVTDAKTGLGHSPSLK